MQLRAFGLPLVAYVCEFFAEQRLAMVTEIMVNEDRTARSLNRKKVGNELFASCELVVIFKQKNPAMNYLFVDRRLEPRPSPTSSRRGAMS